MTAQTRIDRRRRAGYRTRPSGVKGRCAVAARRPAAALDPGASAGPMRPATAGRHSLPAHTRDATTQDQTLKRSPYGSRGLPHHATVSGELRQAPV